MLKRLEASHINRKTGHCSCRKINITVNARSYPSSQVEQKPSLSWADDEQEVQPPGPELGKIIISWLLIAEN